MPLPNITKTTERKPIRLVLHGVPGVGKTTLAAAMPSPIFIRTEDGTQGMEVDAFDLAAKWDDVLSQLRSLVTEQHDYKTCVIDALDGVERLIWDDVCQKAKKSNIADIPYGGGYSLALEQWSRLLAGLSLLRDKGIRVCLIAHTTVKRHASPDLAEYDRYQPRLNDKAMGLICEWADAVGFCRHETVTSETDKGTTQGKSTGRRLLCLDENAAYVAKNRFGISQPIPLNWTSLVPLLKGA